MFNVSENELIKLIFMSFKVAKMSLSYYSCEKSKHTLYKTPTHDIIMFNEVFNS